MTDAINCIYSARPSSEDKELAFLVLKFGGPSLLDILYKANVLPSTSTAYKLAKKSKKLNSSVALSQAVCFQSNITIDATDGEEWTFSIKQDETCVTPKLRFNSNNNQIVGVCYQHASYVKLEFDYLSDAEAIKDMIAKN